MNDVTDKDTTEYPTLDPSAPAPWPQTGSANVQVDLGAASHQGLVRSGNEDHYLVARFGRSLETLLTNVPAEHIPKQVEEVGYALLVADGMGGAAAGEVASRSAISTLISLVLETPDWILSTGERDVERVLRRMEERYTRVDAALHDQGRDDANLAGMGTTMTLAASLGSTLVLGHVGDSRAYLYRGGQLHQLTRDHTIVQALVDIGSLRPDQAARHPFRHVLTHSLGAGERLRGDFQQASLADNDQLLLCTDGLTEMVSPAAIAAVLGRSATADEACQTLVALALENGGRDNVTVVLARYRFGPGTGS